MAEQTRPRDHQGEGGGEYPPPEKHALSCSRFIASGAAPALMKSAAIKAEDPKMKSKTNKSPKRTPHDLFPI
jgi:hypothetical protein